MLWINLVREPVYYLEFLLKLTDAAFLACVLQEVTGIPFFFGRLDYEDELSLRGKIPGGKSDYILDAFPDTLLFTLIWQRFLPG